MLSLSLSLATKQSTTQTQSGKRSLVKKRKLGTLDVNSTQPSRNKPANDERFKLSDVSSLHDKEHVSLVVIVKQTGSSRQTRNGKSYRFVTVCDDSLKETTL